MYAAPLRSDSSAAAIPAHRLQRSDGALDLVVVRGEEGSEPARIFQSGSVRVRFPNTPPGAPLEAVLLNLTGGLTGGDSMDIRAGAHPGASLLLTSQTCERVYRSTGNDAQVSVTVRAGTGATVHYLPQPTILFDGGRLARETHLIVDPDAAVLALEAVVFGRTAMDETVRSGSLSDAVFVRRGGRLIHADRFSIDGDIQTALDDPSVLGGARAMASLRYIAPDAETRLSELRALLDGAAICGAASAWDGMLMARLVAPDGFALQRELVRILAGIRGALPRMWLL